MNTDNIEERRETMKKTTFFMIFAFMVTFLLPAGPALAANEKPNIVVIMGDDIGMWNIGAYHRGLMAGKTPNIDKLAAEGAIFTDYYAEAQKMPPVFADGIVISILNGGVRRVRSGQPACLDPCGHPQAQT
jgi:hypothetical protein